MGYLFRFLAVFRALAKYMLKKDTEKKGILCIRLNANCNVRLRIYSIPALRGCHPYRSNHSISSVGRAACSRSNVMSAYRGVNETVMESIWHRSSIRWSRRTRNNKLTHWKEGGVEQCRAQWATSSGRSTNSCRRRLTRATRISHLRFDANE